jgi:DedD protein
LAAAPLAAATAAAGALAVKGKEESGTAPAETQIAKSESKHDPKSESKAETRPEPKHEVKTEAKPAEKKADDARAKALLEGKPDPAKSADKKPGKFVIQVAALATKEKIDEVQGKLKAGGIKSYTEKVATQSGDRTRIRVGPFASKEEADKVQAKIHKLGLTNAKLVPA